MRDQDDPSQLVAEAAPGLVYVSDSMPGITRVRRGRGFSYFDPHHAPITSAEERARIRALGIPPAYDSVWICPVPNGHIQATGLDQRGRKQYRYHPDWSSWRAEAKFAMLAPFGEVLGRLRARVERDLLGDPGEFPFSLAALITLLDRAHLRVGNPAHTAANGTYGATTLLGSHLRIEDGIVRLRFRAKGGKRVQHTLRDARLHRIFQEIDDLPGRNLFTFVGSNGEVRTVSSQHVNHYLVAISGLPGLTAKTFRTWAGSVAAFASAEAAAPLTIRGMAEAAAERLHNTPMICRKSYIHPAILALTRHGLEDRAALLATIEPAGSPRLRATERRLLGFLRAV